MLIAIKSNDKSLMPDLNALLVKIDSDFWIGQVTNRIYNKIQLLCSKSTNKVRLFIIKKNIADCIIIELVDGAKKTCNIYGTMEY